jgi:hypothetical protein
MLFVALEHWPNGYYQLLIWINFGIAVFVAFVDYQWQKNRQCGFFGIIAVFFNTIVSISTSREIWQPINLVCTLLFVISAFILKEHAKETNEKDR